MLFACSSGLLARDLGVVGPVYPIAEPDMLVTIAQRLESLTDSGELARIEGEAKARYEAYLERPPGVQLPPAAQNRTYTVDPTLTVPYDIKDHEGRVIHPAGTTVNPLDTISLTRRLLFFDGDDPVQTAWARARILGDPHGFKTILTNGPLMALMKEWQERLYFDQGGRLVEQFGIRSVPAVVSQDGRRLRVEEFRLGDAR